MVLVNPIWSKTERTYMPLPGARSGVSLEPISNDWPR
ncbi:hypothetical protein SAMN05518847_102167 [Paenibacillus sp. OV219]|nr:hypothetical protein SAMN05518847_102167 [Paenibacillus sp. OV219]